MVTPRAHITEQNSLIGSSSKIELFHWSQHWHQYLSPYMISPTNICTTAIAYTYIHVMHLIFCGRIFKHTIFEIVYSGKRNTKTKCIPTF